MTPRSRIAPAVAAAVLGASLAAAARPSFGEAATYALDPEHATVAFLVPHIGFAKVLGQFREVEGSFRFDEAAGELSDIEIVVQTESVTTGHEGRDRHLRSADFLDSDRFPRMRFVAASARRTGERTFDIEGELELRGVTRPLTLHATWNKSADYPIGNRAYVTGASARGVVKRSDYGMTYALDNGWVGDEVEILIEIEARRR
ncbi:MAG TPA: YceI family protein [Gammaproteobacteria bacterium]